MADNTQTQELQSSVLAPRASDPQAAPTQSGPRFDAEGYMAAHNLTFKKLTDDGKALVETETGEQGHIDFKDVLKKEGLNPDAQINYNSPESAQNDSPVGLIDRLKLSVGNAKGSVEYLKSKFQGATADAKGDLVVNDKGVWKRVSMDGISNDDGWKASEILGHVADFGGDVLVGAGAAASLVATSGAAAVGMAAAGSGAASAAKAALGRVVGTYDATPIEAAKDIALDALLGAVGEGVAIGAKNAVFPAIKSGFAKISGLNESIQETMAKGMSKLDNEGSDAWRTIFANGDEVTGRLKSAQERAGQRATLKGASMADAAVMPESASTLVKTILEEDATKSAVPLVENIQGNLSNSYGQKLNTIADNMMSERASIEGKLKENAVAIRNTVSQTLEAADLPLDKNGRINPNNLLDYLTQNGTPTDLPGARRQAVTINSLMSRVDGLGSIKIEDREGLKGVLSLQKDIHDILDKLPQGKQDQLSKLGFDTLTNLGVSVGNALPMESRTAFGSLQGWYRESKGMLSSLQGVRDGGNNNIAARSLVDVMKNSSRGSAPAKDVLRRLAEITPGGVDHVQNLAMSNGAMVMGGFKSTEVAGMFQSNAIPGGRLIDGAVAKAAVPTALYISKLQRTASLKSFLGSPGAALFNHTANLIKAGGAAVTSNSDLLGASLTTMFSALEGAPNGQQ
jgi:hypothetical protein